MNELTKKYLKLLHYPLKLENVIDKLDYTPFCASKPFQIDILYHKSLLLYLICTGYPFEKILLDGLADPRSYPLVNSICRECEGELRIMKFNNTKIFEQIGKLCNITYFTREDPHTCFKINEKCINHIYETAEQTLCNISKEILYKHFLLYYNNILTFDIVSYIVNISIDFLT